MTFQQYAQQLEDKIKSAYEDGVNLTQAEQLAAEFLHAQLKVSTELKKYDLDSRMRKSGVKAVRAAVYMSAGSKEGKRPTEAALEAMVNQDSIVCGEQQELDKSEVERDDLQRYYNVFREAHIYFRGISKGKFE